MCRKRPSSHHRALEPSHPLVMCRGGQELDTIGKQSQCKCTFNWLNCQRAYPCTFGLRKMTALVDDKEGSSWWLWQFPLSVHNNPHSFVYSLTYTYNLNEETVNSIRINKANSGCEKLVYFRICDAFGSKLKSYSSSSLRNHREGLLVRSKLSFWTPTRSCFIQITSEAVTHEERKEEMESSPILGDTLCTSPLFLRYALAQQQQQQRSNCSLIYWQNAW